MKTKSPTLGLGTAALGRPVYINVRTNDLQELSLDAFQKQGIDTLEKAYEMGVRYYDTAPGYGLAEELLENWVAEKNDQEIVVASKWGYTYEANFKKNPKLHELKDHSLKTLKTQWTKSKSLLPYLSIYQIHSASFETGVLDDMQVIHELGRIKEEFNVKIGFTTTGANQLEVLKHGLDLEYNEKPLFEVIQSTYNVFDQSLKEIGKELQDRNISFVVKEALANGRIFRSKQFSEYTYAYDYLEQLSNKYSVGVDAIALRFCMDSTDSNIVLSGASNPIHIEQNLLCNTIQLEPSEIQKLESFSVDPSIYWSERKTLQWN